MSSFETIRLEMIEPSIAHITLVRPGKGNAMNAQMIGELTDVAEAISRNEGCRIVILAAEGKSFCAGGDLGWMRQQFEAGKSERRREAQALAHMLKSLDELPQLVIAIVKGAALGGGVGLAAVCDVVIAGPSARFALTETKLGLIPATIAPYLVRRMGVAALRCVGLHGELLGPSEAKALGLVTEIAPEGAEEQAAARHIRQAMDCAPGAVAEAKALFRALAMGIAREEDAVAALVKRWESEEARTGVSAFFAKETPPWRR